MPATNLSILLQDELHIWTRMQETTGELFCQPPRDIRGGMTHADSRVEAPWTWAKFPGNGARLPGWKEVRSAGRSALGARDMKEGDHNHRNKQSQNTFLISLFCASSPALSFSRLAATLKSTQTELSRRASPRTAGGGAKLPVPMDLVEYVHLSELPHRRVFSWFAGHVSDGSGPSRSGEEEVGGKKRRSTLPTERSSNHIPLFFFLRTILPFYELFPVGCVT